jgi:hypothetical protein
MPAVGECIMHITGIKELNSFSGPGDFSEFSRAPRHNGHKEQREETIANSVERNVVSEIPNAKIILESDL